MIPVNEPLLVGRENEYLMDCIESGWISSAGKYIDRFENEWANFCGRTHGVAVSNGTVALELAISVLNLKPGGEVIMPSFTIVSCLEAVLRNGLVPVLIDCDSQTYVMDINEVKKYATENTVAVMAVHIYGHPVNMNDLVPLCARNGWKLIEDAAEAHGSECLVEKTWNLCGSFGDVSCFSFYANKNITTGEGGMVLTDDDTIAELLRSRRNLCFGEVNRFSHIGRGWNFRMTNMQAAIGCAQLERIDSILSHKRRMTEIYNEGLKDLPLATPKVESWAKSTTWMYSILLRDTIEFDSFEFASKLSMEGVQTRPFFMGMHAQSYYLNMGAIAKYSCPITEKIYRRGLYLPSGQAITNDQIYQVIEKVKKVLK